MGDKSISADSVFDWGILGSSMRSLASASGRDDRHVSRYDPGTMNRIQDLGDLVDDSGEESDDDDEGDFRAVDGAVARGGRRGGGGSGLEMGRRNSGGGSNKRDGERESRTRYGVGGVGSTLACRQTMAIVALVGIIVAASVAIGYAVVGNDGPRTRRGAPAYSVASGDGEMEEQQQQQLLELAERIVTACSEQSLDADMTGCQDLCRSRMCCFDSGEYSCRDDESKECGVYAGCEELVEGVLLNGDEEDVVV